jgi:carbon-monoxide dehydrogenase medium subunit
VKPPLFDYVAPSTVDDVVRFLADEDLEVKVIAGGQSLVPLLNFRLARPERLVDVTRVPALGGLESDGQILRIGAAVTQGQVERSHAVAGSWPMVVAAVKLIGHPQIRNKGTVCGSLAHHDPLAELPMVAVALDATMSVRGIDGARTVPAADFFVSTFETALAETDLLEGVSFPVGWPDEGWSVRELARRRGDFATVAVAVRLTLEDETVSRARIVFAGAGTKPVRATAIEELLIGRIVDQALVRELEELVAETLQPLEDIHASASYRKRAAAALTSDAVVEAVSRAHG